MPFRQKIRRVSRNIGSRIDAIFPTPNANESSTSPPNQNAAELSDLSLPQDATTRQFGSDVHVVDQGRKAKEKASVDPPEPVSSSGSGVATVPHQHTSPSQVRAPEGAELFPSNFSTRPIGTDGWANLDEFARSLDQRTGEFASLKAVVQELVACTEIYHRIAGGRSEAKKLQAELEALFPELRLHYNSNISTATTSSTENLCKAIQKDLLYVKEKQSRGSTKQVGEAREDAGRVLACYRRILENLRRLSRNANPTAWMITDELAANARLDSLSPSSPTQYNSNRPIELNRGGCTPGTRIDDLSRIQKWIQNGAAGSVYWLNGMSGTGKTSIAYTMCTELELASNLGANFFCSRSLPECRDVNQIIPSIAYQLAQFSRPFRWALSRVLENEQRVHTQPLRIQLEKLVVQPIEAVKDTLPRDLVVVLDGLDECDSKESTHQVLEVLLMSKVVPPVKFFVTSRPEPAIVGQEKKQRSDRVISQLVLHELDKSTAQHDIETYLRAALQHIEPSDSEIMALVKRTGILFVYATTVVQYIGREDLNQNPHQRLKNVLNIPDVTGNNPCQVLDGLYSLILQTALDSSGLDEEEKNHTKNVLHAVLCAREPLTINALTSLLGLRDPERVYATILPLQPVLHIVDSYGLTLARHASFSDYMFDASRSKQFHCEPVAHNSLLVVRCFDCLTNTKPQFNICGLESSFASDDKVPDMSIRLKTAISTETLYASRYWEVHIHCTKGSSDIFDRFYHFLSSQLLLWMEVMNLHKEITAGAEMLRRAEEWCAHQSCSEDLRRLVHEAWRFVAAFAASPASQSTPHIYATMLPFWLQSSLITKHFAERMQRMIQPKGNALSRRSLSLLTTWPLDGGAYSLIWSPDGAHIVFVVNGQIRVLDSRTGQTALGAPNQAAMAGSFHVTAHTITSMGISSNGACIVSGSSDGAIRIWDSQTGQKPLGPLKGHTKEIKSTAFSSDNRRIVSGSEDSTLRLWDARNGKKLLGSLKGHTGPVRSVAFSPQGTLIASGSKDCTVRIWNARTGHSLLSPFEGHTDSVESVAFSPDGNRIISGSGDRTIRVWDAQTGQSMLSPFEGHTGRVNSVAFSPDATRIVSGADDKAVQVWDAQTGELVAGPLEGHTDSVHSVVFSPSGNHIASGSRDKSIRMWDTQITQLKLSPPPGHIRYVLSVAFSPDGTRIASGSGDYTVQIWDAQTGHPILSPFEGHTDWVNSVAFSSDGTRIVSGAGDFTIRVWDAHTGNAMLSIDERPTNWAYSVAFSPDGTRIVSGSRDNTIRMWDAHTGEATLSPLQGHTQAVKSIAFSPDGARLVSGSWDSTIRVWDTETGQTVLGPLKGHTDMVTSVGFSPDGTRVASGSEDNTVRTWDAQTGKSMLRPFKGHTSQINSVAFSPDSTLVVSGSSDETVRVWHSQTGDSVLSPLKWHTGRVNSVAFSPDGTRIVSGAYDNTIVMWDARIGAALPSSPILASPFSWEITEDGWAVDSNDKSTLLVWVPSDLRPLLLHPRGLFAISKQGYVRLDFDNTCIGTSWAECSESHL